MIGLTLALGYSLENDDMLLTSMRLVMAWEALALTWSTDDNATMFAEALHRILDASIHQSTT